MIQLDDKDRAILSQLQVDASISNQELAKRVNLSPAPCLRRVQRLRASGVIKSTVTVLDREKLGLVVLAFAQVSLDDHHADSVKKFDRTINEFPEVLECFAISGDYDYLLKICAPSMRDYENLLLTKLTQQVPLRSVNTSFVLSGRKNTTALPL